MRAYSLLLQSHNPNIRLCSLVSTHFAHTVAHQSLQEAMYERTTVAQQQVLVYFHVCGSVAA